MPRRFLLISFVVMLSLLGLGAISITFIAAPAGGGGSPVWITSDFSTETTGDIDANGNWSVYTTGDGTPEALVTASDRLELQFDSTADQFDVIAVIHQTDTAGVDQCAYIQFATDATNAGSDTIGFAFRAPAGSTGSSYRVSIQDDDNTAISVKFEKYTDFAFTASIENSGSVGPVADGDWFGAAVIGTGASTYAYFWDFGTTLPAAAAWDGVEGAGSNWGAYSWKSANAPGANAVDTGTKVGLQSYNINHTDGADTELDNFGAGDIND